MARRGVRRTGVAAVGIALAWTPVSGQAAPAGVLLGTVTSDSAGAHGLGNAEVAIPALGLTVRTNWMGDYQISVPVGHYLVTARLVGFRGASDSARVTQGGETRLDFVLDQHVVALDSVVSVAAKERYKSSNLRGFEERMNSHLGGSFVSDSILRASENQTLAEVLSAHVTGMRTLPFAGTQMYAVSTRSGNGDASCGVFQKCATRHIGNVQVPNKCYSTVFVDGVLRYDGTRMDNGTPPPNLNEFNLAEIGGVEFYPGNSTLPAQFANPNACGTLVIWTRER